MAGDRQWVVLCDDSHWRVARVSARAIEETDPRPLDPAQTAELTEPVHEALVGLGYQSEPVLLALGSAWCVAATVPLPTSRHAKKRQAMAYLFEPYAPWAAEDVALDFEVSGATAFMVAAETAPWSPLIGQLESRGVLVDAIVPLARLALQQHLRQTVGLLERYALLWQHEETVEFWLLDRGRPVDWQCLPADSRCVSRAVIARLMAEEETLTIHAQGFTEEESSELSAASGDCLQVELISDATDYRAAAYREAAEILRGKRTPPLNLRRDTLGVGDRYRALRGYLTALLTAALVMFVAVGVALWWQAGQHDHRRTAAGDAQMDLFHRVFPNRKVPVGVHAHLQSELTRLKGLRGTGTDLPRKVESADILLRVLKSLPKDMRLQILETRIEQDRLHLVGHVRVHSDAERIAAALREQGLDVPQPTTHQQDKREIEFRISGRLPAPVNSETGGPS
ncbi:hypothetical protein Mal52_30390 [Symmachiella dynata]|uniref:GspL periplasmic domain protein n=2 Tax=Symmachiella dynata TaxID=2527995 RepID=A0A517ZPY9_9PLAN|nr:hypothetical protein [Symmachiella dynata]QDU44555.1 hypothetical protein Mal52_30390 [Symmachiella dynata]